MDWLQGLLLRLARAGPAGDLKNALLRRRLGLLGGSGAGGALLLLQKATYAGLLLEHMYVLVCICMASYGHYHEPALPA